MEIGENIYLAEDDSRVLEDFLTFYKKDKVLLISDGNVYGLYKDKIEGLLKGYDSYKFIVKPGEGSKSMTVYQEACEFLVDKGFARSSLVLALGGGVVGDLGAFVASTYQRGMDLALVPTSLLSMVDSSVGGKTAINFAGLKNQIGTFYFPKIVYIDPAYLRTLKEDDIKSGLGEIIKYGILKDKDLFYMLREKDSLNYGEIIKKSIETKAFYVHGDEKDQGKRQFLNLGHTLGHAIESLSSYTIPHGQAVAMGIWLTARLGEKLGLTKPGLAGEIQDLLKDLAMDRDIPLDIDKTMDLISHDKKIRSGRIKMIFPVDIGKSTEKTMTLDELKTALGLL